MASTHEKVRHVPASAELFPTPDAASAGVERALRMLEGRWKLVILFHLFGGKVLRFSELERAIPGISQKMLIQQLRQLETDGIVVRTIYHQVPPKVEYGLTPWGQSLCPALDAFLLWAASRPEQTGAPGSETAPPDQLFSGSVASG
jgi:DNA-binding HxlR family transcriptional regulator